MNSPDNEPFGVFTSVFGSDIGVTFKPIESPKHFIDSINSVLNNMDHTPQSNFNRLPVILDVNNSSNESISTKGV